MRIFLFLLTAAITVFLCVVLNSRVLLPAPLGKLLSPQHGIWQNAEPADYDISEELKFPQLLGKVEVSFDDRLVPHVVAEKETDAYFVQGYLHAKYRLWQMEFQTLAAAGRISEVVGEVAINHDREFRRLGMVYAAENSLKAMESDPAIRSECDAYTAGVNAYIESLTAGSLPIEYKLIGYYPEEWSNLKSALFLKYMSYDLAARENDFEMTNARAWFTPEQMSHLFYSAPDSLDPIIPRGTNYLPPGITPLEPIVEPDTSKTEVSPVSKPDPNNGSNNWVVSGTKTATGYPILCNDPHLGLNLPSLWYEMQITTPEFNAYGVTFPGAPSIIIGFNDSIAWGVTNGGRDVRDYYEIVFRDETMKEYMFNGQWTKAEQKIERIRVAGKPDVLDTVAYTVFGPVMYDKSFGGNRTNNDKYYAVRWKAHDASNELKVFNQLNRAKNYQQYLDALRYMETPGQNFAFAARNGDIALRTSGLFPAKWKGQGDVVMSGTDSSFMWQGMIPDAETPFQFNPDRGFVSSANQHPADATYPYYLGWDYPIYRGIIINRMLSSMNNITVEDMMKMQTDNYNVFAEMALKKLLPLADSLQVDNATQKYIQVLKSWNRRNDADSEGATVFEIVWKRFYDEIYQDDYEGAPEVIAKPSSEMLLNGILRDSVYLFADNKATQQVESIGMIFVTAIKNSVKELDSIKASGNLNWADYKSTRVVHLARINEFSRLKLPIGGGNHIINATKQNHGPSWRMIVSMGTEIEAYGVYPGGQSGNPGSPFYDNFVDHWASGKYYKINFYTSGENNSKWKMIFTQ